MKDVLLYDTTLRDGCQAEDISFTLEDKLRIAEKLEELGIDYIEGGYPGSNPRDADFFKQVKKLKLKNAKIASFGTSAAVVGVQQGSPTYVNPSEGDYHLTSTSLGVDYAPADGTTTDLDGHQRPIDLPTVSNNFGPMDVGAYEVQLSCVVSDTIFCNGFEIP